MIAWMLYCGLVAALIGLAARAAESLARAAGYRMRWVWLGALLLTSFLSTTSAVRRFGTARAAVIVAPSGSSSAAIGSADATWSERLQLVAARVQDALDRSLGYAASAIDRRVPAPYAAVSWLAISLLLTMVFGTILHRFKRARRRWPLERIEDVSVRVSPSVGPIVVGVVRPEIVVPRWLLHRAVDEQRLAVAHEQEHLRARDPLALGLGWLAIVAMPWSPAVWYMVSRLRLTIELDCDARVLRRGAAPHAYGTLLIDVAQHAAPLTLSALGLADDSSQLHQRILALGRPVASFARTRAAVATLIAATGLVVACRVSPPPTAVEDTSAGRPVSANAPRRAGRPIVTHLDDVAKAQPLFVIDGIRSNNDSLRDIDPKTIVSVEVLKGPAAQATYGPAAAAGVIVVTTRKGQARR
jgi:TonB-dependent SusC/RagA subfamily outer membrane receptor